MSSSLFVDTSFWLALFRPQDNEYAVAAAWQRHVVRNRISLATTEAVLWETLNSLASVSTRVTAAELYRRLHAAAGVDVVGFEPHFCRAAVDLYAARHDKGWGVVDCFSFSVMQQRGLSEALTNDHHFAQAGFTVLMRQQPPP